MLKRLPFVVVVFLSVYLLVDLRPFGPVDTLAVCAICAAAIVAARRWAKRP